MHARRTTLIFATHGVGAASGLIGLFFIGRFMGPTSYGTFGFALGFIGLWMVFADLGIDTSHARFITKGESLGDCIATFGVLKLLTTTVIITGAGVSVYLWTRSGRFEDASSLPVLLVIILYSAFVTLRTIPATTLNALKLTANAQIMVLLEHAAKLPLVVAAALFYGFMRDESLPFPGIAQRVAEMSPFDRPMTSAEGGLLLASAWGIAMFFSLIVGFVLLGRQSLPRGRFQPRLARLYLLFALPVAVGAAAKVLMTNIDAVFIGWFLSAENVGYYFAAERLSALALIVPMALSTVFFPVFGELSARRELDVMNQVALGLQRALSIIMVLVLLFFVLFPAEGIIIFIGDPFLASRLILPWLGLNVLLFSFATVASTVAVALGAPYTVVKAGAVALLVNVVLNLLLIPDALFGITLFGFHSVGAAVATAAAQAVALILLTRDVRRLTGQTYLRPGSLKHIGAALVTGLTLYALKPILIGERVRVWELGFVGIVAVIVYGALLVAMRELNRGDLVILADALHPRRMVAYVIEETRDKRRR